MALRNICNTLYEIGLLGRYVQKLRSHDWTYQYSDDHRVWRAGQNSYDALKNLRGLCIAEFGAEYQDQKNIDTIWNLYAHELYQIDMEKRYGT